MIWQVGAVVLFVAVMFFGGLFNELRAHEQRLRHARLVETIHRNPGSRASIAAAVELVARDALIRTFADEGMGQVRIVVDGPLWWWQRRAVIRAIRAETPCGVHVKLHFTRRRP